jgi:hypothetical protein
LTGTDALLTPLLNPGVILGVCKMVLKQGLVKFFQLLSYHKNADDGDTDTLLQEIPWKEM